MDVTVQFALQNETPLLDYEQIAALSDEWLQL